MACEIVETGFWEPAQAKNLTEKQTSDNGGEGMVRDSGDRSLTGGTHGKCSFRFKHHVRSGS